MIARYKKSVEPVHTDGRDIDLDVAVLSGEAASQESSGSSDKHIKGMSQVWEKVPQPEVGDPTYYDRPLLNEPVWEWVIPLYYYAGGVTGAGLALGAATQVLGPKNAARLIRRCHWMGSIGACASGALLVFDLGRPSRFLNMLRVFRPTSPMNMGAWILSGTAAASATAILLYGRRGELGIAGSVCSLGAGIFGLGLATYTGVLVANTAVPLWQESRRMLPALFGSSAMSSVGSLFEILDGTTEERRIAKTFGAIGQLAEVAVAVVMEQQASVVPRVGEPLKRGLSGFMWKSAAALTITSAVLGLFPQRSRGKRIAAGVLGTLGSLMMRYAVAHAGVVSARDARASFHQQRAGHGAAELN